MTYSKDRIECFWQVNEKAIARNLKLGHGPSGYILRDGDGQIIVCGKLKDCAKEAVAS